MEHTIFLFKEYCGRQLPCLPFEMPVEQSSTTTTPSSSEIEQILQHNVKVFETDKEKRQLILQVFTDAGFLLVADHITTIIKYKDKDKKVVMKTIHTFDRLVFRG